MANEFSIPPDAVARSKMLKRLQEKAGKARAQRTQPASSQCDCPDKNRDTKRGSASAQAEDD